MTSRPRLPRLLPPSLAALLLTALLAGPAPASDWIVLDDAEWCDNDHGRPDLCEVRETTLPHRDWIEVDSGGNGGIEVEGWDRQEIRLRVKVLIWDADDDEEAERIAEEVVVETDGTITPDGPRRRRNGPHWSVSFRLMVPNRSNLDLHTSNGGVAIRDVNGEIRARTSNGGLSFHNVDGDVRGRTTNGGITLSLQGSSWKGQGLDLRTTNGGVDLTLPAGYSADLETSTVNGRVKSDIPLSMIEKRRGKVRATLGDGGATIRVETTNGGVRIHER